MTGRIFPFVLFAILWTVAPTVSHAESANALGRQGNRFYGEEHYDEAIDAYRRALEIDPSNPILQYNLGTALASKGTTQEAEKALRQAAQSPATPVTRDSWFNLGVALGKPPSTPADSSQTQQAIDRLKKALDAFRRAILTDSQDDAAKYNYELTQERLKKLQEELEKLQQQQQNQQQQNQDQTRQDRQNQDRQQQDQQQKQDQQDSDRSDRQNGLERNPPGTPTPTPTPRAADPDQEQTTPTGAPDEQDRQMTPEQMNALRLLNLLEKENPEQFKRLFQFRGRQRKLDKEW